MAKEKLDLLEFASTTMAQASARAAKIMGCQIGYAGMSGTSLEPVTESQKTLHAEAYREFDRLVELRRIRFLYAELGARTERTRLLCVRSDQTEECCSSLYSARAAAAANIRVKVNFHGVLKIRTTSNTPSNVWAIVIDPSLPRGSIVDKKAGPISFRFFT